MHSGICKGVSLPRTPPKYIIPAHTRRPLALEAGIRSIESFLKTIYFDLILPTTIVQGHLYRFRYAFPSNVSHA
jgi:hypothetical protein